MELDDGKLRYGKGKVRLKEVRVHWVAHVSCVARLKQIFLLQMHVMVNENFDNSHWFCAKAMHLRKTLCHWIIIASIITRRAGSTLMQPGEIFMLICNRLL